jgi:hypothetical protein
LPRESGCGMALGRTALITCLGMIVTSGGIVGAGPANATASPSNLNIDCTNGATGAYDQTFTGAVGETFTLTNTNGSFACVVDSFAGVVTASGLNVADEFQFAPVTFTIVASGQFRVNYNAGRVNISTISVVALSAPAPAQVSTPAPLIQQFGKAASGTCDSAAPEDLNWSGVESGGWGESWAEWMNGGNGGAVCTRTLVYSTAQSKWVVN